MILRAAALCVIAACSAGCVSTPPPVGEPERASESDEPPVSFVDQADGAFDISQFLASRVGFMPVPIVITEPAVGYGGGLGLMFLHDKFAARDADGNSKGPPSITGIAGGYTESDTWFLGGGHFGSWLEDRLRYTGIAGYGFANLDFFGVAGGAAGSSGERSLPFEIEGFMTRQELLAEVADTQLFLGLRYEYSHARTEFESGAAVLDDADLNRSEAALAFVTQFDTRDNIFTPTRGVNARVYVSRYDEIFGGDSDYNRLDVDVPFWVPIGDEVVTSLRPIANFSDDAAPFYALPFISLRGVPALRYLGTAVASVEAEVRWNFTGRWSLVGFGGLGQAADSTSDFGHVDTITAGGGGFRYLIARTFGLQVGLDVAQGPEETVVYIQIGT